VAPTAAQRGAVVGQPGEEASECGPGVAHQVHLGRVVQADAPGVDVDLHGPGLTRVGEELGPRVVRADHEQGVALVHEAPRGVGPQVADASADMRQRLVEDRLAKERRGEAGAQAIGDGQDLVDRPRRPPTHQDRRALGGGQDGDGGVETLLRRQHDAKLEPHRADQGPVPVRLLRGQVEDLDVVGQEYGGRRLRGQGGAHGTVDDEPHLFGDGDRRQVRRAHVLVQRRGVNLLLVRAAEGTAVLLADHRHHRAPVEHGVVEAVEQVHGARPAGGEAAPDAAGVLRVARRHQRRPLLVAPT
jgi:hypothetical protein